MAYQIFGEGLAQHLLQRLAPGRKAPASAGGFFYVLARIVQGVIGLSPGSFSPPPYMPVNRSCKGRVGTVVPPTPKRPANILKRLYNALFINNHPQAITSAGYPGAALSRYVAGKRTDSPREKGLIDLGSFNVRARCM